jgi:hypothetical protein
LPKPNSRETLIKSKFLRCDFAFEYFCKFKEQKILNTFAPVTIALATRGKGCSWDKVVGRNF